MSQTATLLACARCGQTLAPDALVCPNCRELDYKQRLEQLSSEALRYEAVDPLTALRIWRQALDLLPVDSEQYRMIYERMRMLAGGTMSADGNGQAVPLGYGGYERPARARDPWT